MAHLTVLSRLRHAFAAILLGAVALPIHPVASAEPPPAGWEFVAPLGSMQFAGATAVYEGKIHLFGGYDCQSVDYLDLHRRYDPATNQWDDLAPLPSARCYPQAVTVGDRIYVVGGILAGNLETNRVDIYDPATDTWSAGPPLQTQRYAFTAVSIGTQVYSMGGAVAPWTLTSTVERLDTTTGVWTYVAPMPGLPKMNLDAEVVDGRIYSIGGYDYTEWQGLVTVEVYDPSTDVWTPGPPLPSPRTNHGVALIANRLYAVGGTGARADVDVLDLATEEWSVGVPTNVGRTTLSVATAASVMYAFSGGPPDGCPAYTSVERFVCPLIAEAGSDRVVVIGNEVVANGGASGDCYGDLPLSFAWTFTQLPAGSAASLSGASTVECSFNPDVPGIFALQLVVDDGARSSLPDSLTVTAITVDQYVEMVMLEVIATVEGLPVAEVTSRGNQRALVRFLTQVARNAQAGNLDLAMRKLLDVLERTDGCALRGEPDASGPGQDWITTCTAQESIYAPLMEALDALTP